MLMTEDALNVFHDFGGLGSKCSYDHGELLNRGSATYYLNVHYCKKSTNIKEYLSYHSTAVLP